MKDELYDYISLPISVKWAGKNKKHFVELGYKFTKLGDLIQIKDPRHLMPESSVQVFVSCPECKSVRSVQFKGLIRSGSVTCLSCSISNNISGKRFGYLVAVKAVRQPKWISKNNKKTYWLFLCDCGNRKVILGTDVTSGRTISCGCFQRERVGEKNPNWKGDGVDRRHYRPDKKLGKWRRDVFARDNKACVICGSDENIIAHHIAGYHWAKHMRLDRINGVTLCEVCHIEFHSIYGWGNSCDIQFEEYMDNYMSGKRSITKGRSGERQAAAAIRDIFDINVYRGVQYQGSAESPDLRGLQEYGLHCEVKRDEQTITKRLSANLGGSGAIGVYKNEDPIYIIPLNSILSSTINNSTRKVKIVKKLLDGIEQADRDCGDNIPFVLTRRNYDIWYVCVRERYYKEFEKKIKTMPIRIKKEHAK